MLFPLIFTDGSMSQMGGAWTVVAVRTGHTGWTDDWVRTSQMSLVTSGDHLMLIFIVPR